MIDRDKIQALYLNLEMTLNALEGLGENVRLNSSDDYHIGGVSGRVGWDYRAKQWEASTP